MFSDSFCMKDFHFEGGNCCFAAWYSTAHSIHSLILYSMIDMKYCLCIFRLEIKLKDFAQRTQEVLFSTWDCWICFDISDAKSWNFCTHFFNTSHMNFWSWYIWQRGQIKILNLKSIILDVFSQTWVCCWYFLTLFAWRTFTFREKLLFCCIIFHSSFYTVFCIPWLTWNIVCVFSGLK